MITHSLWYNKEYNERYIIQTNVRPIHSDPRNGVGKFFDRARYIARNILGHTK